MAKKEKTKPTKKRVLLYYLILAACILVIAAVTIAVVFSVNGRSNDLLTDKPGSEQDNNPGGNPNENPGDSDGDDVKDTSSAYEFIVPIRDVNLAKAHVFAYNKTMDWYCLHEGMDFSAAAGTEVLAAVDGVVVAISYKNTDILYGDTVTIEHADGVRTVYKFIDLNENIVIGTRVNRGDVIGTVAAANGVENADGDHLHFEVFKNGKIVDPDLYLDILSK